MHIHRALPTLIICSRGENDKILGLKYPPPFLREHGGICELGIHCSWPCENNPLVIMVAGIVFAIFGAGMGTQATPGQQKHQRVIVRHATGHAEAVAGGAGLRGQMLAWLVVAAA